MHECVTTYNTRALLHVVTQGCIIPHIPCRGGELAFGHIVMYRVVTAEHKYCLSLPLGQVPAVDS